MGNRWNSDSFVIGFTDESSIDFVFGLRETRIDIEPHSINIGMFEFNLFTDIWRVSTDIISTEFIGWFGEWGSPRFEEER